MPSNPDRHTRQIAYEVNQQVCHAVLAFLDSGLREHKDRWSRLSMHMQHYPEATLTHVSDVRNASREQDHQHSTKRMRRRPAGV